MSDTEVKMGPKAPVVNGVLQQNANAAKKTTKTAEEQNALGKESFLQLLVCQMQNQDPLEPTSDTEWVSQLATYSSLEQMQNMNKLLTNSQALSLVGQNVVLTKTESDDSTKAISGRVDFVTIKDGDAFLSVGGTLYSMDELVSILDRDYLYEESESEESAS